MCENGKKSMHLVLQSVPTMFFHETNPGFGKTRLASCDSSVVHKPVLSVAAVAATTAASWTVTLSAYVAVLVELDCWLAFELSLAEP